MLSTRADLLPAGVVAELSRLQDQVAPAPPDAVRALLEVELGRPVGEVFAELDPEPIAAASIAQAYRGRLRSGDPVVVKVQRPGIAEAVPSSPPSSAPWSPSNAPSPPCPRGYLVIEAAEQIAAEWARASLAPGSLEELARRELGSLAQRGDLQARVCLFADAEDVRTVTRLLNRVVLAGLGGLVGLLSVMLLGTQGDPPFTGDTSLFQFFGYFGLFCATVLILPRDRGHPA